MSKFCKAKDYDGDKISNSFYLCHLNERCCSEGCCRSHSNKVTQSWYFWLIIMLIFLIFYSCSWYCKNAEKARKRRLQQTTGSRNQSLQGSPRRNEVAVIESVDYSLNPNSNASKVGGKVLEPPPKYQEAVNMPKLMASEQVAQIHFSNEKGVLLISATSSKELVPPSYEDATVKTAEEKP